MAMDWIRKNYDVPAQRGGRVIYEGNGRKEYGTIVSASGPTPQNPLGRAEKRPSLSPDVEAAVSMTRITTHGQNNWQPRTSTVWQQERARGPILGMETPRQSLFSRVWKRRYGNGVVR